MTVDIDRRTALIGTLTASALLASRGSADAYTTALNLTNTDRALTEATHRTSL